jgi:hypothetical protein
MEDPSTSGPMSQLVPSELRRRVESTCSEARTQRARSVTADVALREARQAASVAHVELDVAVASLDQRKLMDHKDQARRSYRLALSVARDPVERQGAATTWLRRIDELNRASRGAIGQVLLLRARCETLDQVVRDASMASNVQRIRTETADARCIEARQHLAELDRWAADPASTVVVPVVWAGAGATRFSHPAEATWHLDPTDANALAVELLLAGDATATRQLAHQMADLTGQQPSRCVLLLQVLAETIIDAAIEHGHLRFDRRHPLWAQLNVAEARSLTRTLRDLGFRYDPGDGWYGQRAPQARDLALALAYAGLEVNSLRRLPSTEELVDLPASISVAPLEHLAEVAPDMDLDDVHQLVGTHAPELADLWDHWADVRALLLGPAPVAIGA